MSTFFNFLSSGAYPKLGVNLFFMLQRAEFLIESYYEPSSQLRKKPILEEMFHCYKKLYVYRLFKGVFPTLEEMKEILTRERYI